MSLRIFIAPLLAVSLLPAIASLNCAAVHAHPGAQETETEKPATFVYVCPMHDDVTAKKPGKCRKCKMKLEKKKIKEPVAKAGDQ